MSRYDGPFRLLLKLGDGFAAACNLAAAALRECERLGLPAPDAVSLSTMGPAMCWRAGKRVGGKKTALYTLYAREADVLCWDGLEPSQRCAAAEAAFWLREKLAAKGG